MSTKSSRAGYAAGIARGPKPTDPNSTGMRAAHPGELGSEGISGAPLSNTAPDNSNFIYQPLRWGIDSLYLSYPGELTSSRESELRSLKTQAQGPSHEAAKAQIQLGSHVFEVKDKSSGLFAFTLVDDAYMIRLAAGKSKKLPMAYVQVSSHVLSHKSPAVIETELRHILRALGDVYAPKVSRVDLFLDFACSLDMEAWRRDAWLTRAKAVHQYAEDATFTGWTIGAGGVLMARLYHKLIESGKSGKVYLHGLWRQAGWVGDLPVWRLEFQFKREILKQLDLEGLPSILDHLGGLWSYASTDWLRLTIPNPDDKTRTRWPIHPLWMALSSVDWSSPGGPLLRSYAPVRAPSLGYLGLRGASVIASIGAVVGITDFDQAAAESKKQAYDAMALVNGMSGITVDQFFREKVEALNREYNTRMNPKPADPPEPFVRNEYERQSRG